MSNDEGFNLHEIERGLRDLQSSGGRVALDLKNERVKLAHARQALRRAKYKATFEASGTVQMKSAYVDEQTDSEQLAVDLAECDVKYAADLVSERRDDRSSLQTRAKLAVESLRLAGYGGNA